jgi:hypothetical protein
VYFGFSAVASASGNKLSIGMVFNYDRLYFLEGSTTSQKLDKSQLFTPTLSAVFLTITYKKGDTTEPALHRTTPASSWLTLQPCFLAVKIRTAK